jgi:hypothetical protein
LARRALGQEATHGRHLLSYRHSDSGGHTGRLTADLIKGFEAQELFRDHEAIEAGVDFAQAIERAVNAECYLGARVEAPSHRAPSPDPIC